MIVLNRCLAAGNHCHHPPFLLSTSLAHLLCTLLCKGLSHFALPSGLHSCTSLPVCLCGTEGAAFTAHKANQGRRQERDGHNSPETEWIYQILPYIYFPPCSGLSCAGHLRWIPWLSQRQPAGACSLPAAGGEMAQGAQHLPEAKSNELESAGLGREQGAGLVPSLLPAAEEILRNDRKATNAST